ncbi:phenylacetate-CoA oxygenase subunit PaaJ [Trebonia kvetii]|uniref:Phenylacetate-CoA oxygenase subunit PaaJ n=1 Tax=Trebonia kvetii TaxID=2480626 RepID=A0A6P2C8F4_9ACTN|nr:phenylacetate-CoA oxygenase subunit PaaJ [Trebonia kvetii]
MVTATSPGQSAYDVAAGTPDPELPMLTIADLGILRGAESTEEGVVVTITPTYSGCPAMREIGADVRHRLMKAGFDRVTVKTQLAPPWTTDWITADGRRKLAEAGIAPPSPAPRRSGPVPVKLSTVPTDLPRCPRCGSASTTETARFSATACKSLHRCEACGEPFEAVKAL